MGATNFWPCWATPDIMRTVRRIREIVGAPIATDGLLLHIGISIGHATWDCTQETVEDALKRADSALYMAKKASKLPQGDLGNLP